VPALLNYFFKNQFLIPPVKVGSKLALLIPYFAKKNKNNFIDRLLSSQKNISS
jgi:hypothetical protein